VFFCSDKSVFIFLFCSFFVLLFLLGLYIYIYIGIIIIIKTQFVEKVPQATMTSLKKLLKKNDLDICRHVAKINYHNKEIYNKNFVQYS